VSSRAGNEADDLLAYPVEWRPEHPRCAAGQACGDLPGAKQLTVYSLAGKLIQERMIITVIPHLAE